MLWVLVALAVYVLILLLVSYISLHPYRIPIFMSPGALGCSQEDAEFFSSDGTPLRGWWSEAPAHLSSQLSALTSPIRQPETANRKQEMVAILSHGYMMNRSELSPVAPLLNSLGISSLVYDFRAHGRSGGKKSYLGYREANDIAAAVAFVRSRKPDAKIVLIGSSMGAAASALFAGDHPGQVDALVLDSAYSNLSSAVLGWWRFVGGTALSIFLAPTVVLAIPFAGFVPWKIDVSAALKKAGNIPILFLHGKSDSLALPSESVRNQECCTGPIEVVWFERCGHSEGRWLIPELYNRSLVAFLEKFVLG
jgi:pimeloyl-ACP methyl ester carboxylesterase